MNDGAGQSRLVDSPAWAARLARLLRRNWETATLLRSEIPERWSDERPDMPEEEVRCGTA